MDFHFRIIEELAEARSFADELQAFAQEIAEELRQLQLPEGLLQRRIEEEFDAPETLLLVAEAHGQKTPLGYCLALPFRDPLTAECLPMIVVLGVRRTERNRGIAHALVQEALRVTQARGQSALAARAGHNDDALISMGERWGFVRAWEWMVRE